MENKPETPAETATAPAAPPAGDQISVAQLARGLALKRRQRTTEAAAPEPEKPVEPKQDAGPEPAPTADQLPPSETGPDPNALWNEGTEPGAAPAEPEAVSADPETEAAPTDGAEAAAEPAAETAAGEEGTVPGGIRKLQKRVDKLTATLRETQEALSKANEVIQTLQAPKEPARGPDPAPSGVVIHPELTRLDGELKSLNETLAWCRENNEGGEVSNGKETQFFDAAAVRKIRDGAELRRTEVAAERAALAAQVRQADAAARAACETVYRQAYGDLEHGQSPQAQEFQRIAAQAPLLRQFPNWKLWVADSIRGRLAREAAMRKAGQPAPRSRETATEPAPVAARPVASAGNGATDPGRQRLRAVAEEFEKSGSMNSLAKVIAAKRAAERAR